MRGLRPIDRRISEAKDDGGRSGEWNIARGAQLEGSLPKYNYTGGPRSLYAVDPSGYRGSFQGVRVNNWAVSGKNWGKKAVSGKHKCCPMKRRECGRWGGTADFQVIASVS